MVKLKFQYYKSWDTLGLNPIINISRALSVQERRLHRCARDYKILGGYIKTINESSGDAEYHGAAVRFNTVHDNWTSRTAIKRGLDKFLQMHKELFQQNPSLKPKWFDFKPMMFPYQSADLDYIDDEKVNLRPKDSRGNDLPFQKAGLNFSEYVTEDSKPAVYAGSQPIAGTNKDEFQAHIIGNTLVSGSGNGVISVGLIESWLKSRPKLKIGDVDEVDLTEDNDIINDPLNMLFNDGDADDEIVENLYNIVNGDGDMEGDMFSPYDPDQIINMTQEQAFAVTSSANPIAYFSGFNALCGFIELDVSNLQTGDVLEIVLEVEPKGVMI